MYKMKNGEQNITFTLKYEEQYTKYTLKYEEQYIKNTLFDIEYHQPEPGIPIYFDDGVHEL